MNRSRWTSKPPPGVGLDWGHPLAQGLAGFWPLNEGAGAVVNSLAAPTPGTTVGSPTWDATPAGSGLSFNGSSQYVDCGTPAGLNGATRAVIAANVYKASNAVSLALGGAAGNSGGGNRFSFIWFTDGNLYISAESAGSTFGYAAVAVGARRIVVAYDGTQGTNATRLRLWTDGVAQTLAFSGTIPSALGNVGPFVLGKDSSDRFGAGSIADVSLWLGRGWSQSDTDALVADPYGPFRPTRRAFWYAAAGSSVSGSGASSASFAATAAGASAASATAASSCTLSAAASGGATAVADGSTAIAMTPAGQGVALAAADGSASVTFGSVSSAASLHAADGFASLALDAVAVGQTSTGSQGVAGLDFAASAYGLVLSAAAGQSAFGTAALATGESIAAASGAASLLCSTAGAGRSAASASGASGVTFAASGVPVGLLVAGVFHSRVFNSRVIL